MEEEGEICPQSEKRREERQLTLDAFQKLANLARQWQAITTTLIAIGDDRKRKIEEEQQPPERASKQQKLEEEERKEKLEEQEQELKQETRSWLEGLPPEILFNVVQQMERPTADFREFVLASKTFYDRINTAYLWKTMLLKKFPEVVLKLANLERKLKGKRLIAEPKDGLPHLTNNLPELLALYKLAQTAASFPQLRRPWDFLKRELEGMPIEQTYMKLLTEAAVKSLQRGDLFWVYLLLYVKRSPVQSEAGKAWLIAQFGSPARFAAQTGLVRAVLKKLPSLRGCEHVALLEGLLRLLELQALAPVVHSFSSIARLEKLGDDARLKRERELQMKEFVLLRRMAGQPNPSPTSTLVPHFGGRMQLVADLLRRARDIQAREDPRTQDFRAGPPKSMLSKGDRLWMLSWMGLKSPAGRVSVLENAVQEGRLALVRTLVEAGVLPSRVSFMRALRHKRAKELVSALLRSSQLRLDPEETEEEEEESLLSRLQSRLSDTYDLALLITKMIAKGALPSSSERINPQTRERQGRRTALLGALSAENLEVVEVVELLLEAGASPDSRTKKGMPAIRVAASQSSWRIMWNLLLRGANPNAVGGDGRSLLHELAGMRTPEHIPALLLERIIHVFGGDPNLQDGLGDSPLHIAVRQGRQEAVQILMQAGADLDLENEKKEKPWSLAQGEKMKQLFRNPPPRFRWVSSPGDPGSMEISGLKISSPISACLSPQEKKKREMEVLAVLQEFAELATAWQAAATTTIAADREEEEEEAKGSRSRSKSKQEQVEKEIVTKLEDLAPEMLMAIISKIEAPAAQFRQLALTSKLIEQALSTAYLWKGKLKTEYRKVFDRLALLAKKVGEEPLSGGAPELRALYELARVVANHPQLQRPFDLLAKELRPYQDSMDLESIHGGLLATAAAESLQRGDSGWLRLIYRTSGKSPITSRAGALWRHEQFGPREASLRVAILKRLAPLRDDCRSNLLKGLLHHLERAKKLPDSASKLQQFTIQRDGLQQLAEQVLTKEDLLQILKWAGLTGLSSQATASALEAETAASVLEAEMTASALEAAIQRNDLGVVRLLVRVGVVPSRASFVMALDTPGLLSELLESKQLRLDPEEGEQESLLSLAQSSLINAFKAADQERLLPRMIAKGARPSSLPGQRTALLGAISADLPRVVKLLLDAGASPDTRSMNDGLPAVIEAARMKNWPVMWSLLLRGADVNAVGRVVGRSLLHVLAGMGDVGKTASMLESIMRLFGGEPNLQDRKGDSPLHVAVEAGRRELVSFLLQRGANPELQNEEGRSPLHIAVEQNRPELLKILLTHDVASSVRDGLLHIAVKANRPEPLEILLEHGANPNSASSVVRDTPLHIAVREDRFTLVRILLKHGANPESLNEAGESPLSLARNEAGESLPSLVQYAAMGEVEQQLQDISGLISVCPSPQEEDESRKKKKKKREMEVLATLQEFAELVTAWQAAATSTTSSSIAADREEEEGKGSKSKQEQIGQKTRSWLENLPPEMLLAIISKIEAPAAHAQLALTSKFIEQAVRTAYLWKKKLKRDYRKVFDKLVELAPELKIKIKPGKEMRALSNDASELRALYELATAAASHPRLQRPFSLLKKELTPSLQADSSLLELIYGGLVATVAIESLQSGDPGWVRALYSSLEVSPIQSDAGRSWMIDQFGRLSVSLRAAALRRLQPLCGELRTELLGALLFHLKKTKELPDSASQLHQVLNEEDLQQIRRWAIERNDPELMHLLRLMGSPPQAALVSAAALQGGARKLMTAIREDKLKLVRSLVQSGVLINREHVDLILSMRHKDRRVQLLRAVLNARQLRLDPKEGKDVNLLGLAYQRIPERARKEMLTKMIARGAKPGHSTIFGGSPTALQHAVQENELEILELLLEAGASPDTRRLEEGLPVVIDAAQRRHWPSMWTLLLWGADVNIQGLRGSLLHALAGAQNVAPIMEILLRVFGANVNQQSYASQTPLHIAVSANRPELVKILLEHDADPNSASRVRDTPLHIAVKQDRPELLKILLEHGANPNSASSVVRDTPLHVAVRENKSGLVRILLRHGADPNSASSVRDTPLHIAVRANRPRLVRILLRHGANPELQNEAGRSPHSLAQDATMKELLQEVRPPERAQQAISSPLLPSSSSLKVFYGEEELPDGVELQGSEQRLKQLSQQPRLLWRTGHPHLFYTLTMLDPDAPRPENPIHANWAHWIRMNLQVHSLAPELTASGMDALSYQGPAPPAGSGPHRYIFRLRRQLEGRLKRLPLLQSRSGLDEAAFVEAYRLGAVEASSQYKVYRE